MGYSAAGPCHAVKSALALIEDIAAPFCDLVNADGLAIISQSSVSLYGHTPPEDLVRAIGSKMLAPYAARLV